MIVKVTWTVFSERSKEETQLDIHLEEARLAVSYQPNGGFSNSLMRIYHIELPGSDCKSWAVNNDDVYEVVWLSFEELQQRISAGDILDVKTIVAYLYLRNYAKL
jgi:ADP-ribose pyrophosphatase